MKILVIGAGATIGLAVRKALEAKHLEVIGASRKAAVKAGLEDAASIRALFKQVKSVQAVVCCAGDAAFRRFAELTGRTSLRGQRGRWLATFCPGRSRGSLGVWASIPGRVPPLALGTPPSCRQRPPRQHHRTRAMLGARRGSTQ